MQTRRMSKSRGGPLMVKNKTASRALVQSNAVLYSLDGDVQPRRDSVRYQCPKPAFGIPVYWITAKTTPQYFLQQLVWLKHGGMCVEGVRQMGCVWYLSLNIMRRECASPISGPVWWQETQCPLIREGSFPSSKIMRWQFIQLSLDRDRVLVGGGKRGDRGRNILQYSPGAFDQTGKATVILCISAGLMKAQLTTLSPSVSLKG